MLKTSFKLTLFFLCYLSLNLIASATNLPSLTRAQAVQLALKSTGVDHPKPQDISCFLDLTPEIAPFICRALENKIINGEKNANFRPNDPISFLEFLKLSLKTYGFNDPQGCFLRGPQWYSPFLDTALKNNLFNNIPNQGQLNAAINIDYAKALLQMISQKKTELNICKNAGPILVSKGANARTDAGNYGNNFISTLIPRGHTITTLGIPFRGKALWYDGREQDLWQAVIIDQKIGFVLASLVSTEIWLEKINNKRENSFAYFIPDSSAPNPYEGCPGRYVQKAAKYQVKGEKAWHLRGLITYQAKDETAQFIANEFIDFYEQAGGICGKIGPPLGPKYFFGDTPADLLNRQFVTIYTEKGVTKTQKLSGFQKSKIGWAQKFSNGLTVYHQPQTQSYYFFKTKQANCVFNLSEDQVCCESPRGQMCHYAFSGGGRIFSKHFTYNNPQWEWHNGNENTNGLPGPIPRGLYNIQKKGAACKFRSPAPHFTCISYLIHQGQSSLIRPQANASNPNGDPVEIRQEIFFHPDDYSAGCIIFYEQVYNGNDVTNWQTEDPKWLEVTKILDGGPLYGQGYAGGSFIGKMLVHE